MTVIVGHVDGVFLVFLFLVLFFDQAALRSVYARGWPALSLVTSYPSSWVLLLVC